MKVEIYILEPLSTMHKYTLGTYNFDESMREKAMENKAKGGGNTLWNWWNQKCYFSVVALGLIFSLDFGHELENPEV